MSKYDAKFSLRRPGDEITEVLFRVNCGNKETYTVQLKNQTIGKVMKLPVELWDETLMRPIKVSKIPQKYIGYKAIHRQLSEIIDMINSKHPGIIEKAVINKLKINKEYLKEEYAEYFGNSKTKGKSKTKVIDVLEKFIQDIENGIILTKEKNRYAKDSIKIYRTLLNNLVMYEYLHETEIRFDVIDINFYDDFVLFLYNEQDCNELNLEKEAYVPSSVGKYIKTLKRILKYAYEKKLTTNTEFKNDYFTAPKGKAFSVALDMDELNRLYNLKLSGNNEIIRDVFLVGCYTGLRYSDYKKVKPENILEVEKDGHKITVLNVNMQKVKDSVSIPLVDQCLKIVQKYGYNMPEVNSVKLNKAIKSICEKAKIDDKIEYTTYKGGIETIECKSKYDMVASHTARRSAITNLYYYYHLTYEEIMKISGHKSIDMLRLYIKISEIENAKIVGIKMINKNNNK